MHVIVCSSNNLILLIAFITLYITKNNLLYYIKIDLHISDIGATELNVSNFQKYFFYTFDIITLVYIFVIIPCVE